MQWLQNKKLARIDKKLQEQVSLDENGIKYKEKGLPEKAFLQAIKDEMSLEEIKKKANLSNEEMGVCLGVLKGKAAIDMRKGNGIEVSITENGKKLLEKGFTEEKLLKKEFPINTSDLRDEERLAFENLRKRKSLLKVSIIKIISAEPTELGKKIIQHGIEEKNILDRLTADMLRSGSWKNKKIRSYDVAINVPNISGGKRHFVNQAIDYIKKIWMDMGFKEMQGNYVQTSFWDLDALFVPQDHPARDMQDTFYIKDPKEGKIPIELMKRVKAAHENGWTTGSKGWQYGWSEKVAKENLLRTHTTVLSAQTIAKLKKEDLSAKFFSVGKVFRNETLSWKSLFEFIQVDGIVVDPDANFN